MATIADYPDGVMVAGPTIARLVVNPPEYETEVFRNEDGGVNVHVQPCGIVIYEIEYDGLDASEVETLRTHINLAKTAVNDFSFYSRYEDATFTGVHYREVSIPRHARTWSNQLKIVLWRLG